MPETDCWPWSDVPDWALRILADSAPDRAFDVVTRTYRARGMGHVTEHANWNLSGKASLEAICRWLRSGSRFIQAPESAVLETISRLGSDPRWHALTREGPGFVVELPPQETDSTLSGLLGGVSILPLIFVQPTPQGPRVHPWVAGVNQATWSSSLPFSGTWDLLSWQGTPDAALAETVALACNVVAAILEAEEEVSVKLRGRREREVAKKMKRVRPTVYRLDPTGMKAWTKKVVQQDEEAARGPSDTTRTVRLHMCKGHKRKTWVTVPGPDEAVIGRRQGKTRKDGTRATLYCVKRPVIGHARGTGVAEKPVVLRST